MVEWTREVPEEDGWFWIKYEGKHGPNAIPCEIFHFDEGRWIAHTARNDTFLSHEGHPMSLERNKDVFFGPKIEPPE